MTAVNSLAVAHLVYEAGLHDLWKPYLQRQRSIVHGRTLIGTVSASGDLACY